jgi:SOS-response transcriptional repressor LexA
MDFTSYLQGYANESGDNAMADYLRKLKEAKDAQAEQAAGPSTADLGTPKSTTLNYNDDGSIDVTHKSTMGSGAVATPVAEQTNLQPTALPALTEQAPTAPTAPVAPEELNTTGLNAPQLQTGTGPTQIPSGEGNIPAAVAPVAPEAQPMAAAPTAPTAPSQPQTGKYTDIIKNIESSGQDLNAQGQPLTSSAGAKYAMQVMPTTAKNPGFGIKPAQSDTPEEYNRVGQEYYAAMLKRYGNNPSMAAAAYNAGPGNMDKALKTANANGGDWHDYLPQETKDYLVKFNKAITDHVATAPEDQKQAALSRAASAPWSIATPGLRAPGEVTKSELDYISANQDNPEALMKMKYDLGASKGANAIIDKQLTSSLIKERDLRDANEQMQQAVTSGNPSAISRLFSKKGDEGSVFMYHFYQTMGNNTAAENEANKLGWNDKWSYSTVGNDRVGVKYAPDGTAKEAVYTTGSNAGQSVGKDVLPQLNGQAMAMKGAQTGQTMGFDQQGHTISHTILPNGQGVKWRDETTGTDLSSAPEGYHLGKDQRGALGDQAYKQSLAADEAENRKQRAAGLAPLYTPGDMETRAQAKRNGIIGLGGTTSAAAPAAAPAAEANVNAAPTATAPATAATAPATAATAATSTLPAELETQAQAIARGDVKMPTGVGANNRRAQALQNRVYQLNPNYDPTIFENRQKTESAFTTGKQGDVVRSMNVAVDHLDTLQKAAAELKNGQTPIFNDIANRYAKATGQTAPGNFDAVKSLVGSEVAKAIAGGATALGDREEIRAEINNTKTPQQLAGVIDKYQHLLAGQMTGLKQQYESGGGRRWDEKVNPRTAEVMGNIGKTGGPTVPGTSIPQNAVLAEIARRKALKEQQ